jgi:hypothetical protein
MAGSTGGGGTGGALANEGTASLTGVTVNFSGNFAEAGAGGIGGAGGFGGGGTGGNGQLGGNGGDGLGGSDANGGNGGNGLGGAILNGATGTLTIDPRQGARKGSRQSKATNTITSNQAVQGAAGAKGEGSLGQSGDGGTPNGARGSSSAGMPGVDGSPGRGLGGGVLLVEGGNATIKNTTISGNMASTAGNDEEMLGVL